MPSVHPIAKDIQTGRFIAGTGGAGRPIGARNKLGEAFVHDLYENWRQFGSATIEQVRQEKPDAYLRVIAQVIPKQIELAGATSMDEMSDEDLIGFLVGLRSAIARSRGKADSLDPGEEAGEG